MDFCLGKGEDEQITDQIQKTATNLNNTLFAQIQGNTKWQGELWRALVVDVKSDVNEATHRAALHNQFLALLADKKSTEKITFTHIYFWYSCASNCLS